LDICIVVENPTNSLYWKTSFAQKFLAILGGFMTDFHNCCHGGSRDKLTTFWSNKEWMQPLKMFCDGQHPHQSWRPKLAMDAWFFLRQKKLRVHGFFVRELSIWSWMWVDVWEQLCMPLWKSK
jgi:hypothetical protein